LITFGFLVIPPLVARQFAGNMRQLAIAASGVGGAAALFGFCISYRWDLRSGRRTWLCWVCSMPWRLPHEKSPVAPDIFEFPGRS